MSPLVTVDARMVHSAGIGTYLQGLLPRLALLRPQWRFELIGPEAISAFDWVKGPSFKVVPCSIPIYGLGEQLGLPSLIPPDTGLFWSPHYNIPLGYRGKLLVTVHDVFHLAMPQFTGGIHKRLYAKFMFSQVRRRASAILCVSRFTKDELGKYAGNRGVEPTVVYNGVDEGWSHIPPGESPHPKPYLLFVGNVKPHKNLRGLLEAFGKVKDRIPQDLVIVGKKEGFITGDGEVLRLAEKMGGRVLFTGEFQHGDPAFRRYYAHADLLVLPSLYESFGLPVLEAMACGCPALVSNLAAFPEVYGEAACYCDPGDGEDMAEKVLALANDKALRAWYAEKGRERAGLYSWDKAAEQVVKVMEGLMGV